MSEKDYRATYLANLGIQDHKLQSRDLQADVVNLDKVRQRLLTSACDQSYARVQIWEFLLGIIPRYKTVRVHTQEQLKEQWSVLRSTAHLIVPLSPDRDLNQYLLVLHLLHTGQLSIMTDSEEIGSGNPGEDKYKYLLIKNIVPLLMNRDHMGKYFIIHEVLLLLDKLTSTSDIVNRIIVKIGRTDQTLAKKLQYPSLNTNNTIITDVLSNLVKSCFVKVLPPCCFAKLLDYIIAWGSSNSLIYVGAQIILKDAMVYHKAATPEVLAEKIKSARLTKQPHLICSGNLLDLSRHELNR